MAPASIVGRYKLYKVGTIKLVQWLASIASRCGAIDAILDTTKPKQKRDNRDQKDAKSKGPQNAAKAIKISTRQLVALAAAIATATPPVGVPPRLVELAKEVIRGRKHCAEWYSTQPMEEDSELSVQNDGHAHFIQVLEEVLQLLQSCVPVLISEPAARKTSTSQEDSGTGNLFALLEDEEPDDEPTPSTLGESSSSKAHSDTKHATRKFEFVDDANADAGFEIWCQLQDLHDIRTSIRETWLEYSRGGLSLFAAGVLTDTGFDIMRRSAAELTDRYPFFGNWWSLMSKLNMQVALSGWLVLLKPAASVSAASASQTKRADSISNPSALLCPAAAVLLRQVRGESMRVSNGGPRNLHDGLGTLLLTHQVHPFGRIIFKHIPRILECVQRGFCNARYDGFILALVDYIRTNYGCPPIWLVVACQAYMNIHDIVGEKFRCGADLLLEGYTHAVAVAEKVGTFHKRFKDHMLKTSWGQYCDTVTTEDATFAKALRELQNATPKQYRELLAKAEPKEGPFEMALDFPVMPCQMLYRVKTQHLHYSTALCNDGFVILTLAHLYTVARDHGVFATLWRDMDWVISQNNSRRAFVMPTSDKADAYAFARHFQLAMGASANGMPREGRKQLPSIQHIFSKARRVQAKSEFLTKLWDQEQIRFGQPRDPIVHAVLRSLTDVPDDAPEGPKVKPGKVDKSASGKSTSPSGLLRTFKRNFVADEIELNFDYATFFQQCGEVMEKIVDAMVPVEPADHEPAKPRGFTVVDGLLRMTAEAVTDYRALTRTLFGRAAMILRASIAEHGGELLRAASDRSSGHLQPSSRPQTLPKNAPNSFTRDFLMTKGFKFDGDKKGAALYTAMNDQHIKSILEEATTSFVILNGAESAMDVPGHAGLMNFMGKRSTELGFHLTAIVEGTRT
ncbi:hypothetical protein LTR56_024325 [Elasticomyces elasticus]|nr:hypothetical protein LTR56_024325 [Elasticomyces elasticus]KAK3646908.1 hypothetical protein LTR22_014061 [Elasticomyces elasticus]KAK4905806.1 hypothetical protein LTR49_024946 [Elasticomyces elasticus]KAK5750329.1 hypothetical protein LTS12_019590 [Elasticomyces elasticus]